MTALRDAIDYTTLGWVKPELDETLRQARLEIEAFAHDPADGSRMRFCVGYLHQVQGTLRMVELYAPAMLAEEMEQLAQALQQNKTPDRDAACATLMRSVVLLPDYLERLQSGHKDIPIVLLPLLNELRAARGEAGLNESVLFAPDLERPLPPSLPDAATGPGAPASATTGALLDTLDAALDAWPDTAAPADAAQLASTLDALIGQSDQEDTRRMWWVASVVASALRDGAMQPTASLRQAFASVQHESRELFKRAGSDAPRVDAMLEPTRQLLYHVAHGDNAASADRSTADQQSHPGLRALRDTFDLDAYLPTGAELDHAQGSLSGRNRALLDTVSAAVKEDLLRVKDVLDLHLRSAESDTAGLQSQVEALGRIADTLGMLGLGVARNVVQQQRDAMQAIVKGHRGADEGALLDIAGALLYVDATLDDQVARLGNDDAGTSRDETFASESRKLLEVVAREAIANFAEARQGFVAFVETSWNHAELVDAPRLLREVAGALSMLELPQPAAYLAGVRLYIENELIGRRRVPNGRQLDTFADALASLEYYLEALRENRFNREEILEIARNSLGSLGYWPLPEKEATADTAAGRDAAADDARWPPAADDVATAAAADRGGEPPELAPAQSSDSDESGAVAETPDGSGSAIATAGGADGFEISGADIDDEIREVFLEEFGEEIDNLDSLLPAWRERPDDPERLRTIRRVFHTLKGSGRLVGARALGEFSWHIENMLNRVLEGARAATPAVVAMVDSAFFTLPQLHAALRGEGVVRADLAQMQALADRIAAGEEVFASAATADLPGEIDTAAAADARADAERSAESAVVAAPETLPASVDALLLEILDAEVAGHLVTVDAWLAQARAEPTPVSDALLRAAHTMNGAFAMTEVPAINDVLGPAEAYLRRLLAAGQPANAEGVAAIGELAELARRTVVALHAPSPRVPISTALAARLAALRDSLADNAALARTHLDEAQRDDLEPASDADLGVTRAPAAVADEVVDADPIERHESGAGSREEGLPEARFSADIPIDPAALDASSSDRYDAPAEYAASPEAEVDAEPAAVHADIAAAAMAERLAAQTQFEADQLETIRIAEEARLLSEQLAFEQAQRAEMQRIEAGRVEAERVEAERAERVRAEAERLEAERVEAERVELARLEVERAEAMRLEAERAEAERIEQARAEAEQLEAERVDMARAEAERADAERLEAARLAEEDEREYARLEREYAEIERRAREQAQAGADSARQAPPETAHLEAEHFEAERAAAEHTETEHFEAEHAETEHAEAEALDVEYAERDRPGADDSEIAPGSEYAFDFTGLDIALVDIFVEEAGDLLDHADGLLAKLREAPGEREPLVGMQRDLHTIKGGARMAGIMAIGELGHAMESLLEAVVENRSELDQDGIPLLERGFDRLFAMVTRVAARHAIEAPDALIAEFVERAAGRHAAGSGAAGDASAPDTRRLAPRIALKPLSAPIDDGVAADDDDIGVRAPQEQVRIRADLLDRLVTYAGEVAIYRARLEQQLGAFRAAMGEMGQTNMRLRDQLRRLDIETEAQIIARYQREGDQNEATFDPLELDRFSTLQQLSRGLGESAADLSSLQGTLDDLTRQYETLLLQQSRVSSDLQEGLMRTRMVPFDALVPRLRRVVRQASGDTGKPVQLRLDGAQGELDRNVLERMTAPLEHMLRNAVAHGLESPEQRKLANKPEEGVVRVAVRREGSEVVLEVSDDGRGLDRAAIRRRAEERELVRRDAVLADGDLDALIFEPGFSTADEVSRLAGRGVGMDVVASEVRQLGGTLDIASRDGQGATFTLRLPQTLAVTQAVFVRIGDTSFAVPIASVRGAGRIARADFEQPGASYSYGGEDYAVHDLGGLVGQLAARADGQLQMPLLLIRSGELRAAVAVDQIIGNREIVVKPVGPQVASIPGIFGATVMGDGSVVVILDIAPLVRRQATLPRYVEPVAAAVAHRVPLVMVVDDSVTMRKVTGRILERHNFEVASARDGVDALERMADRVPDLMLLDIEMPRMDGYELATLMKADPRLRGVPIVMITSRTGEKHRQRALQLGVDRYLGKPYQENELVRNVYELLGLEPRHDG